MITPKEREKLERVKAQILTFDFVSAIGSGIDKDGIHFIPCIKVGQESKAHLIPEQIEGVKLFIHYDKDD